MLTKLKKPVQFYVKSILLALTLLALSQSQSSARHTGPLGTPVAQNYDGIGNVSSRQTSLSTDTLAWDGLGRLVGDSRRDAGNNGFNWSAVYDGLGRRLQTTKQTVTGGTGGATLTLQSSYDPDVEFLELGVTVVGTGRDWLVHGPDLNGVYGGLEGTGGLDAVYNAATGTTTGIVSNLYGHTEATVAAGNVITWNSVHTGGYGPLPGYTPIAIDASHDLTTALAWRGKYVDATGYYCLGTRYYDPVSGTFLSCDPLGHDASMDLYSFCNGDPVNRFDADGRFGSQAMDNYAKGYNLDGAVARAFTDTLQMLRSARAILILPMLPGCSTRAR